MTELEQKAASFCDRISDARLETQGGYPDVWDFRNVDGVNCTIIASIEGTKEPTPTIQPVSEFVAECEELFDLDEDEDDE